MKAQTANVILAILFLLVAGLRISVAFSDPYLSYDGYQNLRFVEHIKDNGTPLYKDNLSYGGRTFSYSPLFHYIMAGFSILLPTITALKFIPNILISLTVFLIYLITYDITKKRLVSLISALFGGFTPIFFSQYINDGSPWTLTIPLLLTAIYGLMNSKERYPLILFSSILLSFISPLNMVLALGLGFFLLIVYLEKLPIEQEFKELFLFILFFSIWSNLIIFKELFLKSGINAVWQGLPTELVNIVFSNITLTDTAYTVGVLSISFGGYAAYHALFNVRLKKVLLIASIGGLIGLLMIAKIMPLKASLVLLAIIFSILAGRGIQIIANYIDKTKIHWIKTPIILLGILFFIFSSMLPAVTLANNNAPDHKIITAMEWINKNTPNNSKVLSAPIEGFLIEHVAKRATVIDNDYILINKANTIYDDVANIYRSRFALSALKIINDYGIDYIVYDNNIKRAYAKNELSYKDNNCLKKVYDDQIEIFEVLCDVRTI